MGAKKRKLLLLPTELSIMAKLRRKSQCSICQKSSDGGSSAEGEGFGEWVSPPPKFFYYFFSFQNSAFWCIFVY